MAKASRGKKRVSNIGSIRKRRSRSNSRKAARKVTRKGRARRTSMLRMKKRMSKRRGSKAKSRSRSRSSSLRRRSKASRKQRGGGCRAISNALPGTDKECLEHAIDETRCRFTPGCEFIR